MKKILTIVYLTILCAYVHAGGSFDYDVELLPLLKQKPELLEFINSTLDFETHGMAGRIGSTVNENLGGKRIGPYRLRAKPKGKEGDYTLELLFHTDKTFLDSKGTEADMTNAVRVVETIMSIEIKTIMKSSNKADVSNPAPPDR